MDEYTNSLSDCEHFLATVLDAGWNAAYAKHSRIPPSDQPVACHYNAACARSRLAYR